MKKIYKLLFTVFFACLCQVAGAQILTFSFLGNNGDEPTVASVSNAAGVQPSIISRGSGVTAAASGDRFNSIGWSTGTAIDLTDYLEITVSPAAGYSIDISSIQLEHRRSSTGPRKFVVRNSLDGYAADATGEVFISDVNTQQSNAFALFAPITTTVPVTFRIYAYAAETATGSWGPGEVGNDLTVFGSMAILPIKFKYVKVSGAGNGLKVSWTNATETDVKEYIVEGAADAQNFVALGTVKAVKNNGGEAAYTFSFLAAGNLQYFRIKGVERDGKTVYSTIVKYSAGTADLGLTLYGNPVQNGQLVFSLDNMPAGDYTLSVYSINGQYLKKSVLKHDGSRRVLSMGAPRARGMYVLAIEGGPALRKPFMVP